MTKCDKKWYVICLGIYMDGNCFIQIRCYAFVLSVYLSNWYYHKTKTYINFAFKEGFCVNHRTIEQKVDKLDRLTMQLDILYNGKMQFCNKKLMVSLK